MFDAHTHIQDLRLTPYLAATLAAAYRAGVEGLCCCAVSPSDWDAITALQSVSSCQPRPVPCDGAASAGLRALARRAEPDAAEPGFSAAIRGEDTHTCDLPVIVPAFGVHPWYAADLPHDWEGDLEARLLAHPAALVGECGLDGIRADTPPELQRAVLQRHLACAAACGRPVVLHGARAWGALLETVRPFVGRLPALIAHSFGGSHDILRAWLGLGGFVSFSGTLCNPAASRVRAAAAATPSDRLLIETDCPDLFPQGGLPCPGCPVPTDPADKGPNHPANLTVVLAALAALRKMPADELAALTHANAARAVSVASAHGCSD